MRSVTAGLLLLCSVIACRSTTPPTRDVAKSTTQILLTETRAGSRQLRLFEHLKSLDLSSAAFMHADVPFRTNIRVYSPQRPPVGTVIAIVRQMNPYRASTGVFNPTFGPPSAAGVPKEHLTLSSCDSASWTAAFLLEGVDSVPDSSVVVRYSGEKLDAALNVHPRINLVRGEPFYIYQKASSTLPPGIAPITALTVEGGAGSTDLFMLALIKSRAGWSAESFSLRRANGVPLFVGTEPADEVRLYLMPAYGKCMVRSL